MTRDQQRASTAAHRVEQVVANLTQKDAKSFSTYAHSLPIWIRVNGLLQAAAFLEVKEEKKAGARALREALSEMLEQAGFTGTGALSRRITQVADGVAYLRWQEEAVSCAAWLKRFSAALIGEPDADGGDD